MEKMRLKQSRKPRSWLKGADSQMKSRDVNYERTLAAAELKQPDQVPVELLMQGDFISSFSGIREREYYLDPGKMLNSQLAVIKRFCKKDFMFNVVPLPGPDFSVCIEASALGCKLRWFENGPPWPMPIVKVASDVDRLEVPDPRRDGLMANVLEIIEYMQQKVDREYFVGPPWSIGAVTVASLVRGINEFMVDIHLRPDMAHKLLRICMETIIEYLKEVENVVGEGFRVIIGDDMSGFLSKKEFETFALPYNKQIYGSFKYNPLNFFHCDSDTHQLVEIIPELGAGIFNMGPPETCGIGQAKGKVGKRICLMGNVAPYDVLAVKTPLEVAKACAEIIGEAGEGGGYILSTGGLIGRGTPLENVDALISAAEKYGQYPLSR